jgi:hypothetical protein
VEVVIIKRRKCKMKKKYQVLMILLMMVFFTFALRAEEAPEAFYDEGPTDPDNGPVAESTGHQTGVEVKKESLKPLWIAGIATCPLCQESCRIKQLRE